MKVAFLFPGQGMEVPRMGVALAARSGAAGTLLERASADTGQDLARLLRRGGHALERTEVLQPALTAVSLGAHAALTAAGCRADLVAGHSLGEIAAWAAAGGVTAAAAVGLASTRGVLMARGAERHPGAMLAVLGPRALAEEALSEARAAGDVTLAAHNGPREWVLSGDAAVLHRLQGRYPSRLLPVAGAWHGARMADVVEPLRRALAAVAAALALIPFVSNRTGELAEAPALPDLLAEQLVEPVRWAGVLSTLHRLGTTDYVTVGPGRVLRGLIRQNLGAGVRVHTTEDPDDIERTAEALGTRPQGAS